MRQLMSARRRSTITYCVVRGLAHLFVGASDVTGAVGRL